MGEYETWKAYAENLQAQRENDAATIEELQEALARVEAERDEFQMMYRSMEDNSMKNARELVATQAQLAEAVGLLRKAMEYSKHIWSSDAHAFLARHAQAEQQEARPATFYDAIKNPPRIAPTLQQEVQGAQDGDERAAFEEATRQAAREFGDEANDEGFARDCSGEFVHRETMQLHRICQLYRAALATQPASPAHAGEFQREDRYIVIKRKDLDQLPMEMRLPLSMALNELAPRLPKRDCLVIESDWPEFEPTWAAIQARIKGRAAVRGDKQ